MKEEARKQRNKEKLAECFPTFAKRVGAVLKEMERRGFRPRIQEGWRSPVDQLRAFESGHSKLKFGFHNVTGPKGEKQSLGVDVLDDNNPLNPGRRYLLNLADCARAQGLVTGILWGLPQHLADGVDKAIQDRQFNADVKIGWDPTHIEPTGVTVSEAKDGKRPS